MISATVLATQQRLTLSRPAAKSIQDLKQPELTTEVQTGPGPTSDRLKTTTTEVDERGSGRLLVAEPQGTFSASGGQPQTHERHIAEVVGNCEYWEGARPARKSSRRTNHKGRTVQRVGGGVTNGGGTVRAVGGIEPGSDPWLVANPTTLPRGQSPHGHKYIPT